jgi:hypothetical protein
MIQKSDMKKVTNKQFIQGQTEQRTRPPLLVVGS